MIDALIKRMTELLEPMEAAGDPQMIERAIAAGVPFSWGHPRASCRPRSAW
jgi:hypothetical protein